MESITPRRPGISRLLMTRDIWDSVPEFSPVKVSMGWIFTFLSSRGMSSRVF